MEMQNLCRRNIEFCCEKNHQYLACKSGQHRALEHGNCYENAQSDTFQVI